MIYCITLLITPRLILDTPTTRSLILDILMKNINTGVITFTEITIFLKFLSKLNYKNLWK